MDKNRFSKKSILWDNDGFSTIGVALALLITISLIFTTARVYEIQTMSAEIQEVADAAALAAENVVAELYIVALVGDALVLSLSLGSLATMGVGIVAACNPVTASISKPLINASKSLEKARNTFSDSLKGSLNKLQDLLPFVAAVKAQEVMKANSKEGYSNYQGVAILCPWEGEQQEKVSYVASNEASQLTDNSIEEVQALAEKAEEAALETRMAKEKAFLHDSGSREDYCLYERAASLALLSGLDNPYFSSVETWSFSASLERAQAYYHARYQQEAPLGGSNEEQANSALRKIFYSYACKTLDRGYVHETQNSFDAYFPLLPKNTSEMRQTSLYTDPLYPRGLAEGKYMAHVWSGCSQYQKQTPSGLVSLGEMESGGYSTCPVCELSASSLGKIAAATSSVESGFEYHYRIVAQAAEEYEKAFKELSPLTDGVKRLTNGLFEKLKAAFEEAAQYRISLAPPGRYGAVVLVANVISSSQSIFVSSFVNNHDSLGVRAAISSATLVSESSEEGRTLIDSFLSNYLDEQSVVALGPGQLAFEIWSGLLEGYTKGHDGLIDTVANVLDSLPLANESGLGQWASSSLKALIRDIGLEPADLRAPKAVLVNSAHVLAADKSSFSAKILSLKRAVISSSSVDTSFFGTALGLAEVYVSDSIEGVSSDFEIATIELFDGAVSIPLTISLPGFVQEDLLGFVRDGFGVLRGLFGSVTGVRQWQ